MPLIVAEKLCKTYGTQEVLDGASFEINEGEKVGLVGANGTGKTTIFRILLGREEPETGTFSKARGLKLGYLSQIQSFNETLTLRQEVESAFAPLVELEKQIHDLGERIAAPKPGDDPKQLLAKFGKLQEQLEHAGGYAYHHKVESVMLGLGFTEADFAQPVHVLSGGQKSRAALAKLLLQESDVLLLDEPTNHLDIDATTWLEDYLNKFAGAVLVISHDRTLLDHTVKRILELENKRVVSWPGNYTEFTELKQEKLLADKRLFGKQQAFIAKTEEFIRRFQAGQRCKEARGRKTRLERAKESGEFLDKPQEGRRGIGLRLESVERSGNDIVICEELSMAYGQRKLFSDLNFRIQRGEKVGIVGPNGIGKTTLLRLLMGREKAVGGSIRLGKNVTVGYYDQQHADLDRTNTVLDELWKIRPKETENAIRTLAGRFLFSGDDVAKTVGKLSGGEQSRVVLAKLIWAGHNFLVLDEPTNHLDIPSREVLEESLDGYDGTLLVVSHDRYFLDRIVDRIIAIRPDGCDDHPGGWSDYADRIARLETQRKAADDAKRQAAEDAERKQRAAKQAEKTAAAAAAKKKPGKGPPDRFAKFSINQIEAEIIKREERLAAVNARFSEPETFRDAAKLDQVKTEYDGLLNELKELNSAWERKAADA